MKFLVQKIKVRRHQLVRVNFSCATKVKLLSNLEFEKYKRGKTYDYRGGWYEESPCEFIVPNDGEWFVVIEKGTFNNPLEVTGSVQLLSGGGPNYKTAGTPIHPEGSGKAAPSNNKNSAALSDTDELLSEASEETTHAEELPVEDGSEDEIIDDLEEENEDEPIPVEDSGSESEDEEENKI